MADRSKITYEPDYAIPPGETLLEIISELGMTQAELALRLDLSEKHVSQIMNGLEPITQMTALGLERVTRIPAQFWNSREAIYRERLERIEDRERLVQDLAWLNSIPVKELVKRSFITEQSDKIRLFGEVLSFFGVSSIEAWKNCWENPKAAARKSRAFTTNPGAVAAWMRIGELQARQIECASYSKVRFKYVLGQIRGLSAHLPKDFANKMQELCASVGVALVFVPEIKGAPLSGLTRWLTSDKAMIQLSLRYKSDDQFWFSFFHEAGHVIDDRKREVFIHDDGANGPHEVKANRFAADFLIPPELQKRLPFLKTKDAVKAFAEELRIAPGIVVGRLQKENLIPYSHMNQLKRKLGWNNAA